MTRPLLRTAPSVMRSSVEMTGMTELPSGIRATREKRNMAASKLLKKVLAPAKKKLPAPEELMSAHLVRCVNADCQSN